MVKTYYLIFTGILMGSRGRCGGVANVTKRLWEPQDICNTYQPTI